MTTQAFKTGVEAGIARCVAVFAVIAALGATQAVAGETYDKIKETKKVTVATEAAFPPFEFIQDGKIVGYGKDLLTYIINDMGVELEQLDLPWQGVLPGLLAGKFDFVATSVGVRADRAMIYAYTVPIADGTLWAMKRVGDDSIKSIDDLSGKVVGTQLASGGESGAKEFDLELKAKGLSGFEELKLFPSYTDSYLSLANGQVDVVINALPNLAVAAKEQKGVFELIGAVGAQNYMGWVTRPEDTDLRDYLSSKILEMRDNGHMDMLQDKWFGFRMEIPSEGYLPPGAL
ncbi:MAG: transporter substrate-binding domain-containing protein [Gammaproteobacteria bacterium]|nr:transporter substrate-binding domain-containing protein [Gammaproteobacteria bacterium]